MHLPNKIFYTYIQKWAIKTFIEIFLLGLIKQVTAKKAHDCSAEMNNWLQQNVQIFLLNLADTITWYNILFKNLHLIFTKWIIYFSLHSPNMHSQWVPSFKTGCVFTIVPLPVHVGDITFAEPVWALFLASDAMIWASPPLPVVISPLLLTVVVSTLDELHTYSPLPPFTCVHVITRTSSTNTY